MNTIVIFNTGKHGMKIRSTGESGDDTRQESSLKAESLIKFDTK